MTALPEPDTPDVGKTKDISNSHPHREQLHCHPRRSPATIRQKVLTDLQGINTIDTLPLDSGFRGGYVDVILFLLTPREVNKNAINKNRKL